MKQWQNWLVPILTFLTVFVLSLLPRQASMVQDRQLTNGVHSEELASDSNFPFQPPSLIERFNMVSRWYLGVEYGEVDEYAADVTEVYQHVMALQDQPELYSQITKELETLMKAGVIPEELYWDDMEFSDITRIYLRDTDSLAGASFLMVDYYDKFTGWMIQMTLDEESGHIANMKIHMEDIRELLLSRLDLPQIADAFLKNLGLDATLKTRDKVVCGYSLEGSSLGFAMFLTGDMLMMMPEIVEPVIPEKTDSDVASTVW